MSNILDNRPGTLTILEGPTLSGKTRQMINILKDAIKHQVPTFFISLELTTEQINNQVPLDGTVSVIHNGYIEDVCSKARILKADTNLKLILIDGLTELYTKHKYCLGREDILSIILKQLKELAHELEIAIIISSSEGAINNKTSKDYIDYIKKT